MPVDSELPGPLKPMGPSALLVIVRAQISQAVTSTSLLGTPAPCGTLHPDIARGSASWAPFLNGSGWGEASHAHNDFDHLGAAVPINLCYPEGGYGPLDMHLIQTEMCCGIKYTWSFKDSAQKCKISRYYLCWIDFRLQCYCGGS